MPRISALLAAVSLAALPMTAAQAQTLTVPSIMEGATAMSVGFSPSTAVGDRLRYVLVDIDWEAFNVELPAGLTEGKIPGPSDPGEGEISWLTLGGVVKDQQRMTVEPSTISLSLPAFAEAGSTLEVDWTGPGFRGDKIFVYRESDNQYLVEVPLDQPSPALVPLNLPEGGYEVLYWYDATKSIMVREWLYVE